jgi:uncharacterized protein (TIGR00730 family)
MKRYTVFCGSGSGKDEILTKQAYALGQALAENKTGLVYGGAKIGLMGAVADGALSRGGEVIGVLPNFLKAKEIAHDHLTALIMVDTMHERKTRMNELSDGVIALPGGYGTLEELFEMLTWAQLGLHHKPIAILNIKGYFDHLLAMIQNMVENELLKKEFHEMLLVSESIDDLLQKMKNYTAPSTGKWIDKNTL